MVNTSVVTYSTLNSADKSSNLTLSNGDLTATASSGSNAGVRSTVGKNSGKLYAEFTLGSTYSSGGGNSGFGIMRASTALTIFGSNNAPGGCLALAFGAGNIYFNGSGITGGLGVFQANQTYPMAVDFGASRLWFRQQGGNWFGNGSATPNPATNTNGLDISAVFPGVDAFLALSFDGNGAIMSINTGASAFTYTVPSGFSAWG